MQPGIAKSTNKTSVIARTFSLLAQQTKKPTLSIIIPTRNEENYLPRLLDSLSKQTFRDFEIIVADNSSTDATLEICRLRGVKTAPGGHPCRGRNEGAKVSIADYYLFLDADVLIGPYFLEMAFEALRKHHADSISFGYRPETSHLVLRFIHKVCQYYFNLCQKVGFPHGLGGALLVKSRVHHSIRGFDETVTVAEDHDYVRRISKRFKYIFVNKPVVCISTRRFRSEGILNLCAKWIRVEYNRIFYDEVRYDKIPYFEPRGD